MRSPSAEHRRKLSDIRERKQRAREQARNAREALTAAGDDREMVGTVKPILAAAQHELELASELEATVLGQLSGVDRFSGITESAFDDPKVVETLAGLAHSSAPIGRLDVGPLMSADDLLGRIESGAWGTQRVAAAGDDVDVTDASRVSPWYGTVPQLRRRIRLLDVIPSSPMSGNSFHFTRESGDLDNIAVETAEGAVKPEASVDLEDDEVIAKTIPAWTKLRRQQLDDVPSLSATMSERLTYLVLRRVENQILAGDGTGENLKGILSTTGVGDIAFSAGEPLTDLTLDAITAVLVSEAEPNAAVLNPLDVSAMYKVKTSGSGERLDVEGAFATPQQPTIWGLPLITSTVIPQGTGLVGDFSQAVRLFVREGVNLRISDADQDDFVRNRITLLAEGRFGVAVFQPKALAVVHFEA